MRLTGPIKFGCRLAAIVLGLAALAAAAGLGRQPILLRFKAPELTGGPRVNTPNTEAIRWESRRGRVTVLHFWTFG